MNLLGKDHFVITWETRGLFEETKNFDALAFDVVAQAEDLFAVMNHFDVEVAISWVTAAGRSLRSWPHRRVPCVYLRSVFGMGP